MARQKMEALARKETGSASARRLRRAEMVPSVIYGGKKLSQPVSVKLADIVKLARGAALENVILDLTFGVGEKKRSETVLVKEVQRDPVTGELLHIDFNVVSLHEKVSVEVPIEGTGDPAGVTQQGGVLESLLRSVKVECLPADIPEEITVDVTSLQIGDNIYVKDLVPPSGVSIIDDVELAVFSVAAPRVEEEVAVAPEEAVAEAAPEEAAEEAGKKETVEEEAEKKKE